MIFGLFIWNRAEGRADARHMDAQLRANSELYREIHRETLEEMKDFMADSALLKKKTQDKRL